MRIVVEQFDSQSGFSATGTASIVRENEHPGLIAGLDVDKSLMLKFEASGDTVTKTLGTPVDVSDYDYLVVSVWSQVGTRSYRKTTDLPFRITIDSGVSYDIPVYSSLTQVQLDLSGVSQVSEITIEALTDTTDHVVFSHMLAVADELPRDIFEAVVDHLESVRDELYPSGVVAGTVTASAGDEAVRIEGLIEYVERYSVIQIVGGGNSETHLVIAEDEHLFRLSGLYDGSTLQNSYTDADVYVVLAAEFGQLEKEALLPSMTVWGFDASPIMRGNATDRVLQSYDGADFFFRQQGKLIEWPMAISCMARQYELIQQMGDIVRRVMARRRLWVNGYPLDVFFDENVDEILPEETVSDVYHVRFTFRVEVREETWPKRSLPKSKEPTTAITMERA